MLTLLYLTTRTHAQQGPQFTQFMFNKLTLNPAYAGADEALSVTAITRKQWTTMEKSPATQTLAVHALLHHRVGLGFVVLHDRIGVHQTTNVRAIYGYHIKVGKRAYASMGLQGVVTNFRSDYASLNVAGNDPKLMNSVRGNRLNVGSGLYVRSPKLDAGISFPALIARNVNVNDTLSINYKNADALFFTSYRIKLNDRFTLEPTVLVKYFTSLPVSYDMNVSLTYRQVITAGVSYRANESIDALLRLQLTAKMQFGYAYDYPLQSDTNPNSVSHELMVNYVFKKNTRNIASPR